MFTIVKMARKRRRSRRRRRRMMKRRRRSVFSRPLLGNNQAVRLDYAWAGQIFDDASSTIGIIKTFSLNNPFEPEPGVPGSTVLGLSNFSSLWQDCLVVGAKMSLSLLPGSVQHAMVYWCETSLLNKLGQPSIDPATVVQGRHTSYRVLAPNPGAASPLTLTRKYSAKKFHGIKDLKDCLELKCVNGNPPVTPTFANFSGVTTHAATFNPTDVMVKISYLCYWSNPVNPP